MSTSQSQSFIQVHKLSLQLIQCGHQIVLDCEGTRLMLSLRVFHRVEFDHLFPIRFKYICQSRIRIHVLLSSCCQSLRKSYNTLSYRLVERWQLRKWPSFDFTPSCCSRSKWHELTLILTRLQSQCSHISQLITHAWRARQQARTNTSQSKTTTDNDRLSMRNESKT